MSATATRPASADIGDRQLEVAAVGLILAVALLVAPTIGRHVSYATTAAAEAPIAVAHEQVRSTPFPANEAGSGLVARGPVAN